MDIPLSLNTMSNVFYLREGLEAALKNIQSNYLVRFELSQIIKQALMNSQMDGDNLKKLWESAQQSLSKSLEMQIKKNLMKS